MRIRQQLIARGYWQQAGDGGAAGGGAGGAPSPSSSEDDDIVALLSDHAGAAGDDDAADDGADDGQPDPDAEVEGDPADDEATDEQDGEKSASLYKVKVNGEEQEVTLDELLAGYQKDADYRQKTEKLAEDRRAAQSERQAALAERQQLGQQLDRYGFQLEAVMQDAQQVDWQTLLDNDPQEFMRQKLRVETAERELMQVNAQRQQLAEVMQQDQVQALNEHVKHEREQLLAKLPEWADESKRKAEMGELRNYMQKQGYRDEEIGQLSDHRALLTIRKAWLFDQLQAKRGSTENKVKAAPPKVIKPSATTSPTDGRNKSMRALKQSGSIKDAASVIENLLD
ncbi:hypothetical protein C8E02_0997 [Vogesella indigofera]|uniref:Uncharacterized protein n=1 Tax=Vogesella indigofera TaxID=45465 RepID=A0A495BIQ5_VOGIN|nr:hypothetical protein [Vogesella indigofera]RKQ61230.1 hypothetical protein C8E02_0997 [Vogesella indigofera]